MLTWQPDDAALGMSPRVRNALAEARRFQVWTNAMVTFGANRVTPGTSFILPVDQILLHSTGKPGFPQGEAKPNTMVGWPIHSGVDLRRPAAWHGTHFGGFAPQSVPFSGAHSSDAQLGLVRVPISSTDPTVIVPQGAKVFGWDPTFDRSAITVDGSDYLELWAGLTPSFWDWATIAPGVEVGWDDRWYPVPMAHPFGAASATAVAGMEDAADGAKLVLYAPQQVQARLEEHSTNGSQMVRSVEFGPGGLAAVDFTPELRGSDEVELRLTSEGEYLLLAARCSPTRLLCRPAGHKDPLEAPAGVLQKADPW